MVMETGNRLGSGGLTATQGVSQSMTLIGMQQVGNGGVEEYNGETEIEGVKIQ